MNFIRKGMWRKLVIVGLIGLVVAIIGCGKKEEPAAAAASS